MEHLRQTASGHPYENEADLIHDHTFRVESKLARCAIYRVCKII
jgi:hypothetical protein